MKALSIRQPWAWLIIHGGKDVENRTWPTLVRGRVLVHAAKGMTRLELEDAAEFAWGVKPSICFPPESEIKRGGIIGSVEIIACVRHNNSLWFQGHWGFILRNPQPLPFKPCRGSLGFFDVDYHAL